ncbi:hypothetical protein FDP41_006961 [Naegleria fowleri]|uniref:nucleoside-diphosphate kinase n=1 Tax=Naegleria fowleri TaxID=5763 RepID=A0A6A5BJ42_NAEFO|nr:uncharacterized protein FDP41_006961 [Naegleria fowleri]KAF0974030.1 hypothetical protein FDP41_006961 [Naegleria fowleri]CAG4718597.1 unnamed protein product [Naegleria fowleri]
MARRFLLPLFIGVGGVLFGSHVFSSSPSNLEADQLPPQGIPNTKHERTFMAIKYDAIQRGNISEIMGRMERKGYKLVGLKLVQPSKTLIENHYADLKGRPFFEGLVNYMTGKPVVAMVWEGKGVIAYSRVMIGTTNPLTAAPGTIRGDLSIDVGRNSVHGSDSAETANNEINLWFTPQEIANYELCTAEWTYEK